MSHKKKICLNMIVKNETKVLDRLFRSLKDYIDYYVIVDTGSTDGTPEFTKARMTEYGIDGEIHHRPWVNFGVNRQQALELATRAAKSDWLLFIDADEELGVSDRAFRQQLEPGVTYLVEKRHGVMRYSVPHLIDIRHNQWRWESPVHNCLCHVSGPNRREKLRDAWIIYHSGQGAKSHGVTQEEKYLRDARTLERHIEDHPSCARSVFYLGQSYRDAGHADKAIAAYRKRSRMKGWDEETFVAQLQVGRMAALLGQSEETVLQEFLAAYDMRPQRAEPFYELAKYIRKQGQPVKAYRFAKMGCQIPRPDDSLFVNAAVYDWKLMDELGVGAYWVGRFEEMKKACELILARAATLQISEKHIRRVERNLAIAVKNDPRVAVS